MVFKQSKRNLERKHLTPLSAIEAPILEKIIKLYPKWVTPDLLTYSALLLGLSLIPIYYRSNFNPNYIWLANLVFLLHWLTDSTDGGLAYYRKTPRPNYGNYIDHVFDNITLLSIFLGLGLSPILSMPAAIALLIVTYLWNIQAAHFSSYEGVLRISSRGFGGTEGRLLVVLMQTHWLVFPNNYIFGMHALELISWIVLSVVTLAFMLDVAKNLAYLRKVDDAALKRRNK
jgi:phosphatidylglycerophosphate synthase